MSATVGSLLEHTFRSLAAGCVDDPRTESEWLLEDLLRFSRTQLYLKRESAVPSGAKERIGTRIKRRLQGEPIQYIIGKVPFFNCTISVSDAVLIPRPETEILAEHALGRIRPGMRVLDIGTGSGALAVAVAAGCEGCRVDAVDISEDALAVARSNAISNSVEGAIRFMQVDFLKKDSIAGQYDVIVTNPPYIPSEDIDGLQAEVKRHEPLLALDGGIDGLDFYRILARRAGMLLNPGGTMLAEIGAGQAADVTGLFMANDDVAGCSTVEDYAGIERIVIAERKEN